MVTTFKAHQKPLVSNVNATSFSYFLNGGHSLNRDLTVTLCTLPDDAYIDEKMSSPIVIAEGHDALLTCVARNSDPQNHTVLWKLGDDVLTASMTRVTPDKRFSVIHDEGGDVYVLAISDVVHTDSGTYVCEINTEPATRSFHQLAVISSALRAPPPRKDHNTNGNYIPDAEMGTGTPIVNFELSPYHKIF